MPASAQIANIDSRYRTFVAAREENPFVTPVLRLALDLASKLENNTLSTAEVGGMVRQMTQDALEYRAQRMGEWIGNANIDENTESLIAMIEDIAAVKGKKRPFAEFKEMVERVVYGFVFTAHPTFTMTQGLTSAIATHAALAAGAEIEEGEAAIEKAMEKPFRTPTLTEENDFALNAICNLHGALGVLQRAVLKVARKNYPKDWKSLRPALCSVGSWVGFDLDGRKDIEWTAIFAKRIAVQMRQIDALKAAIEALQGREKAIEKQLNDCLALLRGTMDSLRVHHEFFERYDVDNDEGFRILQAESRAIVDSGETRLTDPKPLVKLLEAALNKVTNADLAIAIVQILSTLRHSGLSRAEMHVRINAAQLHNALRRNIDLTGHPDDPRHRQEYLDRLHEMLKKDKPSKVHFGDILQEQTSARRQFMIIQQIVKHLDSHSPVRFLIAETESAFTILSALYFARRFGVEKHIDICPLFETQAGLERGSKYLEALLEVPEFVAYIQARGRLCIQTGYSDAGRYIGQTPASGSIERLKERVLRLLSEYDLGDVDLLFFDTHGESIGRGGHPESVEKRMEYICPPAFRVALDKQGVNYTQEDSWQGGDGYLPFMRPESALAVLTRVMEYWLYTPPAKAAKDPFYDDRQGVTQFFSEVTGMQTSLMSRAHYGALLSAFGPNLMHGTGSRAIKRQADRARPEGQATEARQFRAIPHNAILGQMGLLANSVSGVGLAVWKYPEFYERMMDTSPRFQNMMEMVHRAALLSDPLTLKAYIDILDPQLWLMRENACDDAHLAQADIYATVARHLRHHGFHPQMKAVFHDLFEDFIRLREQGGGIADGMDEDAARMRDRLACLHGLRLALIHRIFTLAVMIPRYNPSHALDREDLLQMIFRLDIPAAVDELRRIFPARGARKDLYDFGEESTYKPDADEGYAIEHRRIFDPMLTMHRQIQDISFAIAHYAGFVG